MKLHVNTGETIHLKTSAPIVMSPALPIYDGATEVTPSDVAQVLETAGKGLTENIIVNPIPSNYGLITWNGSYLTVS